MLLLLLCGGVLLLRTLARIRRVGWCAAWRVASARALELPAVGFTGDVSLMFILCYWLVNLAMTWTTGDPAATDFPSAVAILTAVVTDTTAMLAVATIPVVLSGTALRRWIGGAAPLLAVVAGLRYALMLFPVLLLLGYVSYAVLSALGLSAVPQDIFRLLGEAEASAVVKLAVGLAAAVVAPVCEELLFRGYLLPRLIAQRGSPAVAVLLSSLLFAALHQHLGSLLPLFAVSTACSLAYLATGSLLAPIALHAAVNAVGLASFYAQ